MIASSSSAQVIGGGIAAGRAGAQHPGQRLARVVAFGDQGESARGAVLALLPARFPGPLEQAGLPKVIQMDRRGHALQGMDRVYTHVTTEMREQLCAALGDLWQTAIKDRRALSPRSNVALLDRLLIEREGQKAEDIAPNLPPTDPDGHLKRGRTLA